MSIDSSYVCSYRDINDDDDNDEDDIDEGDEGDDDEDDCIDIDSCNNSYVSCCITL